jgi:hypothetical protein
MRAFPVQFDQRAQTVSLEPYGDTTAYVGADPMPCANEFWIEWTKQYFPGADARRVSALAQHLHEQTGERTSANEMCEYASEHPEWDPFPDVLRHAVN